MDVHDIIAKGLDDGELTPEEIGALFDTPLFTPEAALIQQAGRRKSEAACDGKAEVHAQVGLNIAPCPRNCKFCSFAAYNGVFKEGSELGVEDAVERARRSEAQGANVLYFMTTANYDLGRFIETSQEIRRALKPGTPMVANVGDFSLEEARRLKDAGYCGVFHAQRLREGVDTQIPAEKRIETFRNAHEAGLRLGTCVEPVGPEHTTEELVRATIVTREARPCYSGAARRIPIPGSEIEKRGAISEARLGLIAAVVRLALPASIRGNCTHEPNVVGACHGVNLLWAESGANPRDTEADTEKKRGFDTLDCQVMFREAEWEILEGPSVFFTA